jgi:hypothetical protein
MTASNHVPSDASMSAPPTGQKRLVIVGATGMVGGYALRYALDHPVVRSVTSIGRRKVGISHPSWKRFCIRTSQTAPHLRRCSLIGTQPFFA